MLHTLAAPLVAPLCAAALSLSAPVGQPSDGLFPAPTGALVIDWQAEQEPPRLLQVAGQYGALTGQSVAWSSETEQSLAAARVILDRPVTVPSSEVQQFFESLLYESGFALKIIRSDAPRVVGIDSLLDRRRSGGRASAHLIAAEHIEVARAHPALLVTTVIDLPHADVRQLCNTLRATVVDPDSVQLLPIGNASTMVVRGFGGWVADTVDLLRTIDALAAPVTPRPEPALVVIPLQHANATDLCALVQASLAELATVTSVAQARPNSSGDAARTQSPARILSDARSNSLIVAGWPDDVARVRDLVAALDVKSS